MQTRSGWRCLTYLAYRQRYVGHSLPLSETDRRKDSIVGTELATSEPWTGAERRSYPRYDVSCAVRADLHPSGAGSLGRELGINGITINVSRSGILARMDQAIVPVDSLCLTHFFPTDGLYVRPNPQWGTTIRVEPVGEGCQLAIKFDDPLEILTASPGTES